MVLSLKCWAGVRAARASLSIEVMTMTCLNNGQAGPHRVVWKRAELVRTERSRAEWHRAELSSGVASEAGWG